MEKKVKKKIYYLLYLYLFLNQLLTPPDILCKKLPRNLLFLNTYFTFLVKFNYLKKMNFQHFLVI